MHKLDDKQNPHINNRVHQHSRKIQQYANSFKYLSRHNIQLFNKTIVQNLDDYIKRQLYHIRLLISNYTLNTKSDTILECTTNNISIYIYISIYGAREGGKWRWLVHRNIHMSMNCLWIQPWLRVVRKYTFVSIWSACISLITPIHQ